MSKLESGLVLDDDLFEEYHKFRNGMPYDNETIMNLFHFFQRPLVSNLRQYNAKSITLPTNLEGQLANHPLKNETVEGLAQKGTLHKIILSKNKTGFPYLNISDPKNFECNITGCYTVNESRDLARQHLRAMCENAKHIMICDKYLTSTSAANALKDILPRHNLTIEYLAMDPTVFSALKSACAKWTFKPNIKMSGYHDRYLVIDRNVEIILTSGFDNLWDRGYDLTYIVRPIDKPRFA